MSLVNNDSTSSNSYSIDETVKQAINVSDAAQMENNFITLMVAQIRNQDPTDPVDSSEFLNQYSAMSQVKSLENMASMTQSNLVLLDNLQTLTAAGLVGQEVKVTSNSVQLADEPVKGLITLQHAAGVLSLVLTDSRGVSTEINLGAQEPGKVAFELDADKLGLAAGTYQLAVKSDSGEYPTTELAGLVRQVRVSTEGPVLEIDGIGSVPFYNITEFGQAPVAGLL